jgi:Cellulase (glycosyl hydrolase family 5)
MNKKPHSSDYGPCRRFVLRGIAAATFCNVAPSIGVSDPLRSKSINPPSGAAFLSAHDRLRGINIQQPFAHWQKGIPWHPTKGWNVWLPAGRLAAIASAEFDFLRICVDPAPLLAVETTGELDAAIETVTRAIDSALQMRLKVIFDIHVSADHPRWNIHSVTDGPSGSNFLRLVKLETRIAEVVSTRYSPDSVALELFNEPPPSSEFIAKVPWLEQLTVLYESVRRTAPKHTLLLSGTDFSSIDGLNSIDPSGFDSNTVWVFHFYEPTIFCFQGLNMSFFRYIHRLHFPPRSHERADVLERANTLVHMDNDLSMVARVAKAWELNTNIQKYFDLPQNQDYLSRRFDAVAEWADRNGVARNRVICGEFGSFGDFAGRIGAELSDRAAWLGAVRRGVEGLGFNWCVHDLDESFRITDDDGTFLPEILNALGLHVPPAE